MNKTLIALVLIFGLSGNVFGVQDKELSPDAFDWENEDQSRYNGEANEIQKKIEATRNSLRKRYNQCQKIKQKLYDNCLLENLKTSDPSSAIEIRNICKRKSENIPFTTAIFYKDFYVYGFDFCDIKEDPDKYYERLERMFESDEDRLRRKKRLYPDLYD